jgi:hypothetical protein
MKNKSRENHIVLPAIIIVFILLQYSPVRLYSSPAHKPIKFPNQTTELIPICIIICIIFHARSDNRDKN